MTEQLDELTAKLRSVEAEIEAELAKRREELRFRLDHAVLSTAILILVVDYQHSHVTQSPAPA